MRFQYRWGFLSFFIIYIPNSQKKKKIAFHQEINQENLNNRRKLRMWLAKKIKSEKATVEGVIVPEEFLQPYKDEIEKETVHNY